MSLLDNYSYTCGSSLQDIELPEPFKEVYIRNISCYEPIEKLYYSAGYDPICIYCAEEVTGITWKERHLSEINSEALNNYFYTFLLYSDHQYDSSFDRLFQINSSGYWIPTLAGSPGMNGTYRK